MTRSYRISLPGLFLAFLACSAAMMSMSVGAELRFAGVLGNSGASGDSLVEFSGQPASAFGPVLDDDLAIWERGGSNRLNRYALDGRLLASYPLPDSTDRQDQLTRVGDLLLMEIRGDLYTLPTNAEPGTAPTKLDGRADALSSNAHAGRAAVIDSARLSWLDPTTGEREPIATTEDRIAWLHVGEDGTVYGFGSGNVYAWKDGEPVAGFPKGFNGERPCRIGKYWYGHGWHGTIHRMNAAFEPEPGVVLGGASGTFIGYLPESADINCGRGLIHVRDNLFAVSGLAGVVQLLEWSETESRFHPVRRIGAMQELASLAIDAEGNIWTPRGTWRWSASPETSLTLGDVEPALAAQGVVLGGENLCLLKKHYSYVQLAHGPLIDASGWAHFESKGVSDLELPDALPGAAAFRDSRGRLALIATDPTGAAIELPITENGQQAGPPKRTTLPGLKACTSLASFGKNLVAADGGELLLFDRGDSGVWRDLGEMGRFGLECYVHGDGERLVVSDATNGMVHVLSSADRDLVTYEGLDHPTLVAIAGDRIVVHESGRQRLVKLELTDAPAVRERLASAVQDPPKATTAFSDDDYLKLGRPGGLSLRVAVAESAEGLSLSIRTDATDVRVGVANARQAYILDGAGDFQLPSGDWSELRLAASLATAAERDRIGFTDHWPIHAPFSGDAAHWAVFDLDGYRQLIAERKQEIRIPFEQPFDGVATIVIENEAGDRVRNLVSGRSFSAGRHAVVWDGLDENGRLVAPGDYRWRGVVHSGIDPEFRMCFGNGGEDTIAPWGPNHGLLHDAVCNGELVFLAAPVTEGGWALLSVDANGRLVQGYEHQQGFGIGHNAIAADDRYLYCAQDGFGWSGTRGIDFNSSDWTATWTVTVARYDVATGKVVEFPGKKRAFEADTMQVGPGSDHPDLNDYNLGGLAVLNGKLYVGSRDKKAVLVFDAETGEALKSIALEGVRRLRAAGNEILAATDAGVVRLGDGKRLVASGTMDISGLAIAPNGDILLSDRNSHQVHRFDSNGKHVATIGEPGGPYKGKYVPERMVHPAGLTFGPDGKLWVTETRWNPKRVMAWDLDAGRVVYEKFGMPHYGGDGSGFDPENPHRWIGLGCFWDVDVERGTARPTHIMADDEGHFTNYHPHSYSFFREAGRTFLCTRGKIVLFSEILPDGTIHDLAAAAGTHHFAYGCNWNPPRAYIDAFYAKWPEKRGQEKPGRGGEGKPWAQRVGGVLWVDRNGDGKPQQEEFDFTAEGVKFADGPWGHQQTSLTFYFPAVVGEQTRITAIKPNGFLPNGVPNYPTLDEAIAEGLDIDLTPGYKRNGVATIRDRFGRFVFNSDPEMNAYGPDGRHLWTYPNQWSDVHGSHDAPLPQTGVLQGVLGYLGIAPFDEKADVFFMNGNHGRCFLMTSDGLYLDEVFSDVRVSYLKNEYRLGGEIFGGCFGRFDTTGDYYVQIGHGPYRIHRLNGLSTAERIAGAISVSGEQIAAAERRRLREAAQTRAEKKLAVPGSIAWDQSGRFKTELSASLEDDALRLVWRVQDPSPWVNNGRDWRMLFATGDTVDLQIGTDPAANPKRGGPVVGDKRLLIAPHDGRPIAVLYEHRKPGGENPVDFASPWRGERVDNVARIDAAEIDVQVSGGGYVVDAKIPLAALGLSVSDKTHRADFGVTFGDAEGQETQLRSYWANSATMLVDDIPGEIMLHPNLWGEMTFEEQ